MGGARRAHGTRETYWVELEVGERVLIDTEYGAAVQ